MAQKRTSSTAVMAARTAPQAVLHREAAVSGLILQGITTSWRQQAAGKTLVPRVAVFFGSEAA